MQIRAEQKNTRQSPRKVRLIANQVKGLSLEAAFTQLALMERRSSLVLMKVLRQAVANAVNNHQLNVKDLEIEKFVVKTGQTYKRMRPVSRGRAHRILKRTCHIEVILKTQAVATAKANQADTKAKKIAKKQAAVKASKKVIKTTTSKVKVKPTVVPVKKDSSKVTKQTVTPVKMFTNRRASSSR